jgi:hypothetical protein
MNKYEIRNYILKRLKKKLNRIAEFNNLSSYKLQKTSEYINKIVVYNRNRYAKGSIPEAFMESDHEIRTRVLRRVKFPSIPVWTIHAKKHGYLSVESMEYILQMNWQTFRKTLYKKMNKIRSRIKKFKTARKMIFKYSRLFT